jgi:citrate lyase beta subunit
MRSSRSARRTIKEADNGRAYLEEFVVGQEFPSGVMKMDGNMLDKPHMRAAETVLALRGR